MPVRSTLVVVAATPTILAGPGGPAGDNREVLVGNGSAVTLFVGGDDVTIVNGFPVAAGASAGIVLATGDTLYGVVAAATQNINVLQTRV